MIQIEIITKEVMNRIEIMMAVVAVAAVVVHHPIKEKQALTQDLEDPAKKHKIICMLEVVEQVILVEG